MFDEAERAAQSVDPWNTDCWLWGERMGGDYDYDYVLDKDQIKTEIEMTISSYLWDRCVALKRLRVMATYGWESIAIEMSIQELVNEIRRKKLDERIRLFYYMIKFHIVKLDSLEDNSEISSDLLVLYQAELNKSYGTRAYNRSYERLLNCEDDLIIQALSLKKALEEEFISQYVAQLAENERAYRDFVRRESDDCYNDPDDGIKVGGYEWCCRHGGPPDW